MGKRSRAARNRTYRKTRRQYLKAHEGPATRAATKRRGTDTGNNSMLVEESDAKSTVQLEGETNNIVGLRKRKRCSDEHSHDACHMQTRKSPALASKRSAAKRCSINKTPTAPSFVGERSAANVDENRSPVVESDDHASNPDEEGPESNGSESEVDENDAEADCDPQDDATGSESEPEMEETNAPAESNAPADYPVMDEGSFQREVLKRLDEIHAKQEQLFKLVSDLIGQFKGATASYALRLLPEPLVTKAGVDALEERVANNPADRQALIQFFSRLCGATPKNLATAIMNRLMDASAANSFNIQGSALRVSFRTYNLYDMVFEAVRLGFPNAGKECETDVHRAILENLASACGRLTRRRKRMSLDSARREEAEWRSIRRDEEAQELNNA